MPSRATCSPASRRIWCACCALIGELARRRVREHFLAGVGRLGEQAEVGLRGIVGAFAGELERAVISGMLQRALQASDANDTSWTIDAAALVATAVLQQTTEEVTL